MITLTSKCYYVADDKSRPKISCKGLSKKQNPMTLERYLEALQGCIDMATNTGFHLLNQNIVTYTKDKLGLSAYYDKHMVAPNIHTKPLR